MPTAVITCIRSAVVFQVVDRREIGELASKAAAHSWTFTRRGLEDAAAAMGWEVVPANEDRLDLRTGGPFEPAWAMCDGDEVLVLEFSLVPPVEIDDPEDDDRTEDVEVEMFELFQAAAGAVQDALGQPVFNGGRAHPRFPDGEDFATWLAFWTTKSARFAVKQLHHDSGLPYFLSFVVEPLE